MSPRKIPRLTDLIRKPSSEGSDAASPKAPAQAPPVRDPEPAGKETSGGEKMSDEGAPPPPDGALPPDPLDPVPPRAPRHESDRAVAPPKQEPPEATPPEEDQEPAAEPPVPEEPAGAPPEPSLSAEREWSLGAPSPSEEDVAPRVAEIVDELEAAARPRYARWLDRVSRVFSEATTGPFDITGLENEIRELTENPDLLDALFTESFRPHDEARFLHRKSVNVAIYSLRLGRSLGIEGDEAIDLGLAGLLHKIGMAQLPEDLVMKPGSLSRRERQQLREHPLAGSQIVREAIGSRGDVVSRWVRQAHERVDGSGYPDGLRGDQIDRHALVIGLVDSFEAMIQPRPYRERLLPFTAVKELLEQDRARFPRELLRAFVKTFSAFPPFAYVRLNSNEIARVVETEPGHPLRPVVQIVLDSRGKRPATAQIVRLRESPLLYITGPVDQETLPV